MMKKRNLLILMISAFFVLTGCGIPNIFTIGSSISVPSGNITNNSITAQYRVTQSHPEELTKINPAHGPKIFLGYVITGEESTFDGFSSTTLQTAFEKKAGKTPNGRHITKQAYYLEKGIFTVDKDDVSYKIYPFSDSKQSKYTSPDYHIAYQDSAPIADANKLNTDFTLTFNQTSKDIELTLTNSTYKNQLEDGNLRRFEDQDFESPNNVDSDVVGEGTGNWYVHIFAAVNISQGYFTNIYWSPISYLGSIKIKE